MAQGGGRGDSGFLPIRPGARRMSPIGSSSFNPYVSGITLPPVGSPFVMSPTGTDPILDDPLGRGQVRRAIPRERSE